MSVKKANINRYIILSGVLAIFVLADIFSGSVIIPFKDIFKSLLGADVSEFVNNIIWSYRLPKTLTAVLAGIALSVSGLQMQTLFRNPLADPFILGISAGAGFGVALFVMGFSATGIDISSTFLSGFGTAAAGWLGALGVTLLILLVSEKLRDNLSILIFGIMLGSVLSALISLLQYLSNSTSLKVFVLWTMGSFANLNSNQLIILSFLVIVGFIISVYNIKDLNILLMGETYAKSLGVNLKGTRKRILIATTLLAGSITAFCGPIGFIGIAVPHVSRMLFRNANHKILIPVSALIGASIMLFTDIVAQLPGQNSVIPINTVSAIIGVPIILLIILKSRIS
jgi:iron complex transport system permease protein